MAIINTATPQPIPEGWAWAKLSEISVFIGRGRGPTYVETDGAPVINQKCIRWRSIDKRYLKLTAATAFNKLPETLRLRAGDILWNSTGSGTIGRATIYDGSLGDVTCDSHVTIVRLRECEPAYVAYLIETTRVQHLVVGGNVGSTNQLELPRSFVEELPVPLPPLAEQKRIVARIDELFAEIAEGEAALTRAREGLETFRRALLKSAVTGEMTREWRETHRPEFTGPQLVEQIRKNRIGGAAKKSRKRSHQSADIDYTDLPPLPDTWAWASLAELGDFGRGKSRHRPRDDARLYGGTTPFIQTGIVANCGDFIDRYDQTYSDFGVVQSRLWPPGTVCITIAANIAKTGILKIAACFPDSIVGLTPMAPVDPYFIHLWIQTVQKRLERFAPATAQKNINLEVLEKVAVPIPPPDESEEILRRVYEALSAHADSLALLDAEAADAARLRQAVLKAAFEGRLVPQDPEDEPASAMLERLAAEPTNVAPRRRGRPKRAER